MAGTPRRRSKATGGALLAAGRLIADRRMTMALTQADLADLAGVGLSSVRSFEAGRASVTLDVALRILHALGLTAVIGPARTLPVADEAVVLRPPSEPR